MAYLPSLHATIALAITVAMFWAFARAKLGVEIVSLLTIVLIALVLYVFPLPGGAPTEGLELAFSGFGNYALVTICALMVMGRGLVTTGALEPAARVIERVWKFNRTLGMLVSLLLAFALSTMINDTPVLVLLLPIFVQLASRGVMPSSKTLMPLNAAVLIGGMATTIGTSTNLLVVSIASDLGLPHMNVFHFTPLVLIAGAIALPYLWLVAPHLLPDNSGPERTTERRFVSRLRVGGGSELAGKPLDQVRKSLPADVELDPAIVMPLVERQDVRITGTHEGLEEANRLLNSASAPGWILEQITAEASRDGEVVVVTELALTVDSRLIGHTLETSGIGENHGVAILGTHKPARTGMISQPYYLETLREGDVLLAMGTMARLQDFAEADSLLMLDAVREVPRRSKALLALGIMAGSVFTAAIGILPIAIAALGGSIAMLITGCVRFDRIGQALSAKVIVLVAASIAVGKLVLESGAAAWLGMVFAGVLQFLPPAAVLAAIMIFSTILTNFSSNATAATVGTPIAFNIAQKLGLPAEPMVLAVLFGCNLCYATPIAYQTNMLIMGEGGYRFRDYVRMGLPLIGIMVVSLSILLALKFQL
ncbi:MAG: SLC13 family permease [Sphingomonadales bacterium]|nr:SLC13 family permease [Sphingomonadales bacterium]MDE2570201.1 SLC13 family permease [Sphingomonadales bacterium]